MSRILWRGAISFGLVTIPVVLKPASRNNTIDLDWIDRRDMSPVGYQRINKRTGKAVESIHIAKGYQYSKGEYVLLTEEDFVKANVEATQTVDIVSFVKAAEIPPYYFETPYYLEPDRHGAKGYALLRETMRRTGYAALALVVIRARQHLAAVLVSDDVLVMNTMRFSEEILSVDDLTIPANGARATGVSAREVDMAAKLVEDMAEPWSPEQYHDTYRADLMKQIEKRIDAGQTHSVEEADTPDAAPRKSADIIDMMDLIRDSLAQRKGKSAPAKSAARKSTATAKKAPARKRTTSSGKSSAASSRSSDTPRRKRA
jgi:DNA end-binding protein Ku